MRKVKLLFYELIIWVYHIKHPVCHDATPIIMNADTDELLCWREQEGQKHFWSDWRHDLYVRAVIWVQLEKYPDPRWK